MSPGRGLYFFFTFGALFTIVQVLKQGENMCSVMSTGLPVLNLN